MNGHAQIIEMSFQFSTDHEHVEFWDNVCVFFNRYHLGHEY